VIVRNRRLSIAGSVSSQPSATGRPSRRLWWTLLKGVTALALILVAVAAAELYIRYRDKARDMQVLHQEVAASSAFKVREFVANIERTMRVASYHQDSVLNGVSASMQFQLLGMLKAEPAIVTVAALDSSGRERAKVARDHLVVPSDLADLSSSVAFQRAHAGRTYYGRPYFVRGSEPHLTVAVPISWFDGEVGGVLVAEVALLYISEVISKAVVGEGGYLYVVSEQDELIAHPDASLVLQHRNVADLDQTKLTATSLAPPDRTYPSLNGNQVFAAAVVVEDLGWTVVVEQNAEEVLAPLWISFARTCAFALATLAVAAYLSILVRRRVLRPLDALEAGARKVGQGDFAHRINLRSGDEFETVAEAFDQMSERLQQLYIALEQHGDRLKLELTTALLDAADLAKRSGDGERLAGTALGYQSSISDRPDEARAAVALLEEALSANPASGPALLVALDTALCRAYVLADKASDAIQTYQRALAGARALGSETLLFQAHYAMACAAWPDHLQARIEAGRKAMSLAERLPRPANEIGTLSSLFFKSLVEVGDFAEAKRVAAKLRSEAGRDDNPTLARVAQRLEVLLAMQLSARREIENGIDAARNSIPDGFQSASDLHFIQLFTLRREQGRAGELKEIAEERCRTPSDAAAWEPLLALLYLDMGAQEEGRRLFDRFTSRGYDTPPHTWLVTTAHLAECAALLADKPQAKVLRERLMPYADRNVVSEAVCLGGVERYLGLLEECLGDHAGAIRRFRAAVTFHQAEFQPVWLAHSQLDLARVLASGARADRWEEASLLIAEAKAAASRGGLRELTDDCQKLLARRPPYAEQKQAAPLSPSEKRVLRLLATGATNRAIGEQLTLSPHTVANHVRNILAKTNSANRTEAANFARENELLGDNEEK
jgi:DNA-binding CsgD family transcriptional regulator/HAMP domain-containing protein